MQINLTDTEVCEIISKYTDISFDENDVRNGIITESAVREAILCDYGVIHKSDMVGKPWSEYEKLRKLQKLKQN